MNERIRDAVIEAIARPGIVIRIIVDEGVTQIDFDLVPAVLVFDHDRILFFNGSKEEFAAHFHDL